MHQQSKILYHAEKEGIHLVEEKVGIHMVKTIVDPAKPTLLYLPGLSSEAVEGFNCLVPLLERGLNLASMSFRGRGRSTTPEKDYSIAHHADDLELVINDLNAEKLILVATSISTLYAVKYLLNHGCDQVSGIIIVDHPLRIRKLKRGWAEEFSKITVNGVPVTSTMRKTALERIEVESEDLDFYFDFEELELPTLVMYPSIPKGILSIDDIGLFNKQHLTKLVEFEDSDHFIRLREPDKFLNEIDLFANEVTNMKEL